MLDINDYQEERECFYQGEKYCVRDNGAVLRYPKKINKIRLLDNKWTFGKVGNHGYLYIAGKPIHRIVATAFYGDKVSSQYIVDHIDTNKQNNRPENLRWITKEENILNNPNTIDKLEYITGCSIDELKENNWEKLHKYTSENQDTSWMRPTTKEETENLHKRQEQWLKHSKMDKEKQKLYEQLSQISKMHDEENKMGNWVYSELDFSQKYDDIYNYYYYSNTVNAVQTYQTITSFPFCPLFISKEPMMDYYLNLQKNKIFAVNKYYVSIIEKVDFNDVKNEIILECRSLDEEGIYTFSIFKVTYQCGYFIHEYKKKFDTIEECDICYDYELGKIPFDENNIVLFDYEYN